MTGNKQTTSSVFKTSGNVVINLRYISRISYSAVGFCTIVYKDNSSSDCFTFQEQEYRDLVTAFEAYQQQIALIPPQNLTIDAIQVLELIGPELKGVLNDHITDIAKTIEQRVLSEVASKIDGEVTSTLGQVRNSNREITDATNATRKRLSEMEVQLQQSSKQLSDIVQLLQKIITIA